MVAEIVDNILADHCVSRNNNILFDGGKASPIGTKEPRANVVVTMTAHENVGHRRETERTLR
jgi:hypothetical protein